MTCYAPRHTTVGRAKMWLGMRLGGWRSAKVGLRNGCKSIVEFDTGGFAGHKKVRNAFRKGG